MSFRQLSKRTRGSENWLMDAYKWYRGAKGRAAPPGATFNSKVKRVINRNKERKLRDFGLATTTPIAGTSLVSLISGIPTGNTDVDRDGNEILITGLEMNLRVMNDADVVASATYRVIIFRANKNIEGAVPGILELLEVDEVFEHTQHDTRSDFTIIYDKIGTINAAVTAADRNAHILRYKKFWKPKKCTYANTSGAVAGAEKGQYFVVMMTDQVSGLQPTFTSKFRIHFKEF